MREGGREKKKKNRGGGEGEEGIVGRMAGHSLTRSLTNQPLSSSSSSFPYQIFKCFHTLS